MLMAWLGSQVASAMMTPTASQIINRMTSTPQMRRRLRRVYD